MSTDIIKKTADDLASTSAKLQILLLICKGSEIKQIKNVVTIFMSLIKKKYNISCYYEMNPIHNKIGRFSGFCTLYLADLRVYHLFRGFNINGVETVRSIPNPNMLAKEAAYAAAMFEAATKTTINPFDKDKIEFSLNKCWGYEGSLLDELDLKYGLDNVSKKVPDITLPVINFNVKQRARNSRLSETGVINVGLMGIDRPSIKNKEHNILFVQSLPSVVTRETIFEWLNPLCNNHFKIEMMKRGHNSCAKVIFSDTWDSHRVFHMYRTRYIVLGGRSERIGFSYYFSSIQIKLTGLHTNNYSKGGNTRGRNSPRGSPRGSPRYGSRSASPSFGVSSNRY